MKTVFTILIALMALAINASAVTRTLLWDDLNPPGVVQSFNVYFTPQMPAQWSAVASTPMTSAPVEFAGEQGFFAVTAVLKDGTEIPEIVTLTKDGGISEHGLSRTLTDSHGPFKLSTPRMR